MDVYNDQDEVFKSLFLDGILLVFEICSAETNSDSSTAYKMQVLHAGQTLSIPRPLLMFHSLYFYIDRVTVEAYAFIKFVLTKLISLPFTRKHSGQCVFGTLN